MEYCWWPAERISGYRRMLRWLPGRMKAAALSSFHSHLTRFSLLLRQIHQESSGSSIQDAIMILVIEDTLSPSATRHLIVPDGIHRTVYFHFRRGRFPTGASGPGSSAYDPCSEMKKHSFGLPIIECIRSEIPPIVSWSPKSTGLSMYTILFRRSVRVKTAVNFEW